MSQINKISKITIQNLEKLNIEITPEAYSKEFCNVAKEENFVNKQCEIFENALLELSAEEIEANDAHEINSMYDLVGILLKRPNASDFEQQTSDVAKLVKIIDRYLNDAISTNKSGSFAINNLKDDLSSVNIKDSMENIKSKLIKTVTNIQDEISTVGEKLENGKMEISALESKVQELAIDLSKYKKESRTDHLTGLLLRRAYDKEISKFEDTYIRDKQDYAIVFFDLDNFKLVNDNYGHDCGDSVLRTFGQILNKLTRKTDIVSRYGGEEFVAAIKYKNEAELAHYLKRVKDIVTNNKFTYNKFKLSITFSAGVDIRSSHTTYENTIQQTDILLYEAKDTGKNKIVLGSGTVI